MMDHDDSYLPRNIVPCYYNSLIMKPGVSEYDFETRAIWTVRDKALAEIMTEEEKANEKACELDEFLKVMRKVFEKANEQDGGGATYTSYCVLGEVIEKCWIEWRLGSGEEQEQRVIKYGANHVSNHRNGGSNLRK